MSCEIPATNEMTSFLHCKQCINEWKDHKAPGLSPREYASLEIGYTKWGFQVWCKRHDCNVLHIDFEGEMHPANLDRLADES
ncbi:hypothetical protein LCGC14_1031550 [marine sediment metagenome]|uniref:Uncharacterized protein n=1 Tax=marine sediment metagenome TaxID=412755 RepID=A0A0F9QCI0_9ZZZZ